MGVEYLYETVHFCDHCGERRPHDVLLEDETGMEIASCNYCGALAADFEE